MSTLEDGKSVGRYRIERFLGAGAMGEVYVAEDPHIGRRLAIKTVRLTGRPQEVEERSRRLLREARAAGRLLHPHIVTLFDAGETEGQLYLAFEYVEGADLATRMVTPPPLSLSEVLRIVRETAEALEYAHGQGIVHRDIKPSNILLDTAGRVKVADFGIAKVAGQATELTVAGSVVGSPQYLSPEQIRGEDLDGRSDLFSLGVVFYELLSGRRPFDGETLTTLVYQILHKEPPPVSELRGGIPPRLEQLLAGMLAKDLDGRMKSAGEAAREIAAIEMELPDETLAGPAAVDGQAVVPTRALPRRTTAQIPPPPIPPPPPGAAGTPGTAGSAGPASASSGAPAPVAAPLAAAAPRSTAPTGGAADRIRILIVGGLVLIMALALAGSTVWWLKNRRAGAESAPAATEVSALATEPVPGTTTSPGTPGNTATAVPPSTSPASPPVVSPPPVANAAPSSPPVNPRSAPPGSPNAPGATQRPVPDTSRPADGRTTSTAPAPNVPGRVPNPRVPVPLPERPAPAPPAAEEQEPADEAPAPRNVNADERRQTGLSVVFRVTPPDAHVLVDRTVIGTASEWSGQKGGRTYTLEPGDHVIKIRKPGLRDYVIQVDARETAGTTPITVRLQALPLAEVASGDLPTYRVSQAIGFRGVPGDAEVFVDGRSVGPARQYSARFGGGGWLSLQSGKHQVSVVLPRGGRRDYVVEVFEGAAKERERIDVGGGGD